MLKHTCQIAKITLLSSMMIFIIIGCGGGGGPVAPTMELTVGEILGPDSVDEYACGEYRIEASGDTGINYQWSVSNEAWGSFSYPESDCTKFFASSVSQETSVEIQVTVTSDHDGPILVTREINVMNSFILRDNVVVIYGTSLTLVDIIGEQYIYQYDSAPPLIEIGDILMGSTDGGYLRKVESIQDTDSQLIIDTSQAALGDAIEKGHISALLDFSGRGAGSYDENINHYGADYHQIGPINIDLSGIKIPFSDNITAEFDDNSEIVLTPVIEFDIVQEDWGISYLKFAVEGPENEIDRNFIDMNFDVTVTATGHFEKGSEILVYTYPVPIVIVIEGVPVPIGTILISIFAGIRINATIEPKISFGFDATCPLKLGVEYSNGDWDEVINISEPGTNEHPLSGNVKGNANLTVYLRPEFSVLLLGIVGPGLSAEPYLELDGEGQLSTQCITYELAAGVSTKVIFKLFLFDIFGHEIHEVSPRYPFYNGDYPEGCSSTDPPYWVSDIGIQSAEPGDSKITVTYGTATVPGGGDVTYNLYYIDEIQTGKDDPFDWQGQVKENIVSPYELITYNDFFNIKNGHPYCLAVRAQNQQGIEDDNTVVKCAIPLKPGPDTDPPKWVYVTGIEQVSPGDGEVSVKYGDAYDEGSPPVEYLLYKDDDDDPFDQTPVVVSTSDPYTFDNLINGETYWFGVRCRDSANPPNIDDNENVLSAMPSAISHDMVLIPAGEFIMGGWENYEGDIGPFTVNLPAFYISDHETTNAEYKQFVDATGHRAPDDWTGNMYPDGKANHPVIYVDWYDAAAYCEWAGLRLPTEIEWEKAARGTDGRIYPWGDTWDEDKCRNWSNRDPVYNTCEVWDYPDGRSPYGLYNMAGNVWEWTADWWDNWGESESYQRYKSGDLTPPPTGTSRVVRGGSWYYIYTGWFRCAYRNNYRPDARDFSVGGFRCARTL